MKKKMTSPDFDLKDWAQRLEAGSTDDPELVLARQLAALKETPAQPAEGFSAVLRSRLLTKDRWQGRSKVAQKNFPFPKAKWLLPSLAAAFALVVVLLALPRGVQGVSAAEVLHAAQIGSRQPAGGQVIYDRLRLDWAMNENQVENVLGEVWYVPGSQVYRYQLTSSTGEMLFFQAYDGHHTTQSVHTRAVGKQPMEEVYQFKGFVPLSIDQPGEGGLLANPSPVNFWLLAVRQALERKSDCTDLFCLLGLSEDGWECAGMRCSYTFGGTETMGGMGLELALHGKTRLEDGSEVYEIRLLPSGALLQYLTGFGTVYVDVDTNQIVKVNYSMKSVFTSVRIEMSVEHLERNYLQRAELPADFFNTSPAGVRLVAWEGDLRKFIDSQFGDTENRAWVISTDPPSGTEISGVVTFNLELGYRLTGLPYANLHSMLWGIGKDTAAGGSTTRIEAGEGIVQMSFTIDTDELAGGAWALGTDFGIKTDAGSGFAVNDLNLFDTQWCVRCDPAALPTQPAVLGTYWRPLVKVVTAGQVAEGYHLTGVRVSPTHVLLHRAGVYSEAELPQTVETVPIDLGEVTQTQVLSVNLVLPPVGEMVGSPVVKVTLEIEPAAP